MRFYEIINERVREGYLYHGTSLRNASVILKDDEFAPKTEHLPSKHRGAPFPRKNVSGVSLTRDIRLAEKFGPVVFALDRTKLATRYKIEPMDYYGFSPEPELVGLGRRQDRYAEAEEFVVGSISPAHLYIASFWLTPAAMRSFALPEFSGIKEFLLNHPLYKG